MREIRFRAWVEEKGFSEPFGLGKYPMWNGSTSPYWASMATVQQFTGLHDKNGVEIYEGDILGPGNGELVFYKGGGFDPFAIPGWECTSDPEYTEVIGNVHENPDLLKEQS